MSPPSRVGARCWGPDARVASSKFENAEIAQAVARLAELREKSKGNEDTKEIRKIFARLRKTEVTVEALRQTGVGTEVNHIFFRQHPEEDIRAFSAELVHRWKDMVCVNMPRRDVQALHSTHNASEASTVLEESPRPAISASEFLARARQGVQGVQAKKAEERRAALKKARETEKRRIEKRLKVEAELQRKREAEKKRRRCAARAKSEHKRPEQASRTEAHSSLCDGSPGEVPGSTAANLSEATTIELNVNGVERLGIGFFPEPGEWTVANIVGGGFVDTWNKEHESTRICLGDKIIDINGDALLEEKPPLALAADGLLRLRLRKASAPMQQQAPSGTDSVAHSQDCKDECGKHRDKELVCSLGHTLIFSKVTLELQGSCDLCGQRVSAGDAVLDCRACNWYMCKNCEVQAKQASQH